MISKVLNTTSEISAEILKRNLNFSTISPKSLKHYTLQQSLATGKIDYPFLLEEI